MGSGGGDHLAGVGSEDGDVIEDRESSPCWAISVEQIEQHKTIIGDEHCLGGSTLTAQRELEDVAVTYFSTRLGHLNALHVRLLTNVN